MRIGITYGTFDVLHYGHVNLLKRAKEMCDILIVGLSTDEFNELKGKKSFLNYKERYELLNSLSYVDIIIPEETWEQKQSDIDKYNIDILFMGDDWKGRFDYLNCDVKYFPRTSIISSSLIKEILTEVL